MQVQLFSSFQVPVLQSWRKSLNEVIATAAKTVNNLKIRFKIDVSSMFRRISATKCSISHCHTEDKALT
jgi:hypothetical protein